jgi:hypothetical protein
VIRFLLGFIPGVGPIASAAVGAVSGLSWKAWAAGGGLVFLLISGWQVHSYVARAEADHVALITEGQQLDSAIADSKLNSQALQDLRVHDEAVAQASNEARASAEARAVTLKRQLEAFRHVPKIACSVTPAAHDTLAGLRQ